MNTGTNVGVGSTNMSQLDFMAVGIYFLLIMITGIYSMCRPNRNTEAGYFLAGRFMWWLPVGASLFASNIGSEHFIGLAGSGAASGISVGAFELNALILLQLLGWVFLPVFMASGVSTLPQYMHKRFGGKRIETCLALLSLVLYIFTKISVNLYSGALFIEAALGWKNLYVSVLVLIALTAALTIFGGLAAVIYTDTLQFFIMNIGSIFLTVTALSAVGGYTSLQKKYLQAIPDKLVPNTTCGIPREDSWVMLRDPVSSDMPWPAFILGQTPASIWYWCADQMMVQRAMASKSLSHAQGATLFAGFAKIFPLFLMVIPGMISRVLFTNEIACADVDVCMESCGSHSCSNFAYPKLVFELMPSGMRGVMLSVMLSALISDLTSIFNSASTLFTMDIWTLFRPKARETEKIYVGKCFIVVLVVVAVVWIPVIEQTQGGELYIYIQSVAAYLSPPIAAVYTLAILYPPINETGAFWSLIVGFCVGMCRMIIDFTYREPSCFEQDNRPILLRHFHYMYFAMGLFWLSVFLGISISFCTKQIPEWRLIRTTYSTRFDKQQREDEIQDKEQGSLISMKTQSNETSDVKKSFARRFNEMFKFDNKPQESDEAMRKHIAQLSSLHQEQWQKKLLNSFLIVILSIAICSYIGLSINPFTPGQVQQIQYEILQNIRNISYSN